MIIKIKCDDNANIFDVLDQVILHRNNKDGTYLFRHYKIHKTTTAKQVEYVVENIDTATASELAQRVNNIQRKYVI